MRRSPPTVLVLALFILAGCGDDGGGSTPTFALPDGDVFPEGVAVDKETGTLYVGSTADGAVYRGDVDDEDSLEVFLEPGVDGRDEVVGMKVRDGLLFVAGRGSGRVFVHDVDDGSLVRVLEAPPADETLLNDLSFAGDAAYVTDSFRPVLFRISLAGGEVGDLEPWLDLEGSPIAYEGGFNLNGISGSDDGRHLLAVQSNSGTLWRIDVETKDIVAVDLDGEALTSGDGLLLDGTTLYVVRNEPGVVVRIELADDLASGEVVEELEDDSFAFPTTIAELDGRLFVVNSQLDRRPGEAVRPSTVSAVDLG